MFPHLPFRGMIVRKRRSRAVVARVPYTPFLMFGAGEPCETAPQSREDCHEIFRCDRGGRRAAEFPRAGTGRAGAAAREKHQGGRDRDPACRLPSQFRLARGRLVRQVRATLRENPHARAYRRAGRQGARQRRAHRPHHRGLHLGLSRARSDQSRHVSPWADRPRRLEDRLEGSRLLRAAEAGSRRS